MAFLTRSRSSCSPKWSSMLAVLKSIAVGLATPFPTASSKVCLAPGSKTAASWEKLAPDTNPAVEWIYQIHYFCYKSLTIFLNIYYIPPPTKPAPKLEMIFPYKLGITMTSNCCGFDTNCIVALSTIICSNFIWGYSWNIILFNVILKRLSKPASI